MDFQQMKIERQPFDKDYEMGYDEKEAHEVTQKNPGVISLRLVLPTALEEGCRHVVKRDFQVHRSIRHSISEPAAAGIQVMAKEFPADA